MVREIQNRLKTSVWHSIPFANWIFQNTYGTKINLSQLRWVGIHVPFNDVALATFALSQNLPFWTRDKQFLTIQKALPELQFFDETI